jgi:hypothetical protein
MSSRFIKYYAYAVMVIMTLVIIEALCCQSANAKERFIYDISVLNAKAATAVMVYKHDKHEGRKVLKLFGTLETKGNWKEVYPLRDQVMSVIDENAFPIQSFMELDRKKNKHVFSLNFGSKRIKGTKKINDRKEKAILRKMNIPTHDLISWVDYLRNLKFELKKPFSFKVFSGRFYKVVGVPTKIEDVWTRSGLISAYKIEALVTNTRKKKKFNKRVEAWISADEKRLPLQMIFASILGEIRVLLTDVK